jgi:hypothetical protein
MMKLAFRKTNSPGVLPGLVNDYTRWRLMTDYPHGGVIIGDTLWHMTLKGVIQEPFRNFSDWDVFKTPVSDEVALARIAKVRNMKYDRGSLLAFYFPWRITDSSRAYCYEFQWYLLTDENPNRPIVPGTLTAELLRQLNADVIL